MIKLAREINDSMPDFAVKKLIELLKGVENPVITILGVAYKANTDDYRETPALKIIELSLKNKWQVKIHDPIIKNFYYPIEKDFDNATKGSDCLVLITDHDFYKSINPLKINNMRNKNIFDSRNLIDEKEWITAGFKTKILGKESNF
jgi:UDP-N-acetyl-D-mannosaminuronic acid dehydrogenase